MPIVLTLNTATNFLEFPSTSIGGDRLVETHGVISELTDAALAAKFTTTTAAQAGDYVWVGTAPDLVQYRMKQGETNAQLAASWEEVKGGGATLQTVTAVGHLIEVQAFPSAGINGVIQDPLRSRAEIGALGALQQTPEDAPYLVEDASGIWHIGRFQLQFPTEGLDGILFRPAGFEVSDRTLIWDADQDELWILEPVSDGGQAYRVSPSERENIQAFGDIASISDTDLAAKFRKASDAQSGDVIWVASRDPDVLYQMNAGAVDARLAASWSAITPTQAVSSGALDAGGIIQSPLRDRAELAALGNFQSAQGPYLVQQTPGDDNSWALGRISQFGTTLDDLVFRPQGLEVTVPTIVWVEDSRQAFLLDPSGSRAAITVHPSIATFDAAALGDAFAAADSAAPGDLFWLRPEVQRTRYRMKAGVTDARLATSWEADAVGGGTGTGTIDAAKTVETHGAIAELTDAALAAKFAEADEAQSGDIIYVGDDQYRMLPGATDARLAASWGQDSAATDDVYDSASSSTNPLTHAAIAGEFTRIIGGAPENGDTLKKLYDIIQGDHTQPQLITYDAATLTSAVLEYSHIYFVDLRGTTADNRLTLQLPGAETTDLRMDIVIRDLPIDTFKDGYLAIEALPNGATPVQILTPQGLTDDSIATVSAFDLRGSEIYLARTVGSNRWMINIRLEGAKTTEIWTGNLSSQPDPALYRIWIPQDADPGTLRYFSPAESIWRDA